MTRAIELSKKAKGQTSPNPIVGAVIVKNNKIIAEGFHKKAGSDHAEIVALKKLRKGQAKGATLYVTLEPCCHKEKRTPPCVEAILAAGFRRVVVGTLDPNPKVSGKGVRHLRGGGYRKGSDTSARRGVSVTTGILEKECRDLNFAYNKWIKTGLPFVTLKVASTLDGKIADASGNSKWITGEKSRRLVHQMRSEVDAILVGAGTARKDNPLLNVRLPRYIGKQPMAVVVAGKKPLSKNLKLFKVKNRTVVIEQNKKGCVDLKALLKKLGKIGVTHLMVEGGGAIFSSFLKEKLTDRLCLFLAPKLLGGQALDWFPKSNIRNLKDALELDNISVKTLRDDMLIEGFLRK
ncbi:MAG: bifunctional diaminohydroxyphosphoribosylaminopyrimidine deaminase/5-amino-6-(5-phosphoribosylamino)uracil reductase RibD [Deltaproteobacteria bacterium]|nr:bifunctional diaminohydroxyphosphoribosylaminopyrimidine deaminase/5-amino-6-(5-phosphoribosylamino)uracil reductase RibD [Deltaproteobacteria bacterium]